MYIKGNSSVKSTFSIEILDETEGNTIKLSVYPPKMKVLKKISKLSEDADKTEFEILDSMLEILSDALSSNKESISVSVEYLENVLDTEDIQSVFKDFFNWVADVKKNRNSISPISGK